MNGITASHLEEPEKNPFLLRIVLRLNKDMCILCNRKLKHKGNRTSQLVMEKRNNSLAGHLGPCSNKMTSSERHCGACPESVSSPPRHRAWVVCICIFLLWFLTLVLSLTEYYITSPRSVSAVFVITVSTKSALCFSTMPLSSVLCNLCPKPQL